MKMKKDTRSLVLFILMMIAAMLAGAIIAFLLIQGGELKFVQQFPRYLNHFLTVIAPWFIPGCILLLAVPAFCLYGRAEKLRRAWDGEDEAAYNKIDRILGTAMLLSSVCFQLSMLGLGIAFVYGSPVNLLVAGVSMLLSIASQVIHSNLVVKSTQKMNPEKKGCVYDPAFQKEWMSNCDEAEKKVIGEAALAAFKFLNNLSSTLWLLLIMIHLVYPMGLSPFVVLAVIQISTTVVFHSKANRLSSSVGVITRT